MFKILESASRVAIVDHLFSKIACCRHLQFDPPCLKYPSGLFSHSTMNLLDFKGKLFGLVFNVSCCLLRSLQFDPLFPITHPHTITLLHALLYYVHCLSHVRSRDGQCYSKRDIIIMSLLLMNDEPHALRVYNPRIISS